jgi:hypothetical protein
MKIVFLKNSKFEQDVVFEDNLKVKKEQKYFF